MKEISKNENVIGCFTNWVDTLARRTRGVYVKNELKHITHFCIDDVPESCFVMDEMEISYTFIENDGFAFESELLMKAFAELSKTHKRLLELLYVEKKTPHEVAAILGCTVENIYNQRSKAFRVIKKVIREGKLNENDE